MPNLKQIYEMMEAQQTPNVRIWNMNREKLFLFENDDVESTKQQMETLLPYISSYGKVIVEAATKVMKVRNWTGAFKWTCQFEPPAGGVIAGPLNPWTAGIPAGYVSNDVMMAKLELIQSEMRHTREMDALKTQMKESSNADPMKQLEKIIPAALYLFGKPMDEVQKIAGLYQTAGTGAIAGPPGTHILTFSDVQKLPDAEKQTKCQELANELAKYVSLEEMIILQSKLIDKLKVDPKFMQTIFLYI